LGQAQTWWDPSGGCSCSFPAVANAYPVDVARTFRRLPQPGLPTRSRPRDRRDQGSQAVRRRDYRQQMPWQAVPWHSRPPRVQSSTWPTKRRLPM